MMQRIVWQRNDRGRARIIHASFVGVLGFSLLGVSMGEAAICKVGGPAPTHGTIDLAVDDPTCKLVKVAKGTYVESVTITRTVELQGNGVETIISAPGGGCIVSISGSGVKAKVKRVTISGPVPVGTSSLSAVCVEGNAYASIENNVITDISEDTFSGIGSNTDFDAIMVGGAGGPGTALIRGNLIQRYQKSGIVVDGVGSFAEIRQNSTFGSPRVSASSPATYGIQVSRGARAEVSGNRVTDHSNLAADDLSVGILLFEAGDGVAVSGNNLSGNDTGICVKQTNNAQIERNRVSDSRFDGIALDNQDPGKSTSNNTVSQNIVQRNGEGVSLLSANNNTIDRNTSNNNNGAGFLVSCDNAGVGCTQAESSDNIFTANTAINNAFEGYLDESTGSGTAGTANTYADNKCSGNGEGSNPDGLCLPQQP
jgi:parallel beta-helix repeat protein